MTTEERLDRLEQTMFTVAQILNGGVDPRQVKNMEWGTVQPRESLAAFCRQVSV